MFTVGFVGVITLNFDDYFLESVKAIVTTIVQNLTFVNNWLFV